MARGGPPRRASGVGVRGGGVSFPGGRQDADGDRVGTALREAHEEIGLAPATVEIIGELDHLSTVTSDSFIVPFVALLPGPPADLTANPDEVAAVLPVPLVELFDPGVYREKRWAIFGTQRAMFFFELTGDTVWGPPATGFLGNLIRATVGAMVLIALLRLAKR